MRGLVLVEFGRMEVRELPDPVPGPGEVVLDIAFTGICGSDLHGFTGANGRRVPGQVMGHETAGRVRSLGAGVTGLASGTPVTINPVILPADEADAWRGREQQHPGKWIIGVRPDHVAAFAQQVVVPARNVVPLPAGMPVAHGALVEPVAVATHAVRRLPAVPDAVLVTGGGPIGQSVVVALQRAGVAIVLVSEPTAGRRKVLARLGAVVLDPAAGPLRDQVLAARGEPVTAAVDAVGSSGSLTDCLTATAPGATICLVGMATPRLELPAFEISTAERTLVGSFTYSSTDFERALHGLADAPASADNLINRTVPLDDAPDAFAALAAGDGTPGKVLVDLS
ncbi:MAG: alcohol dehydrogenase catalytic domain-containing protein [Actinobacteria bacterium]|nr:alcohol dehydrogenase catalytic domain-containing protein [Actinomycetota bacterium]